MKRTYLVRLKNAEPIKVTAEYFTIDATGALVFSDNWPILAIANGKWISVADAAADQQIQPARKT